MPGSKENQHPIPKEVYKRKIHDKYSQVFSPSGLEEGKKYLIREHDEVVGHLIPLSEAKKLDSGYLEVECKGKIRNGNIDTDFDRFTLNWVGIVPSPLTKFWTQNLWLQDPDKIES